VEVKVAKDGGLVIDVVRGRAQPPRMINGREPPIEGPLVDEESRELEEGCGAGARPSFIKINSRGTG
jgi:hypothetical protein